MDHHIGLKPSMSFFFRFLKYLLHFFGLWLDDRNNFRHFCAWMAWIMTNSQWNDRIGVIVVVVVVLKSDVF